MPDPSLHPLLEELEWRGLLYQRTEGLSAALHAGTVAGYIGFDPTADSLHVGNLVVVMGLVHLQRAGHRPVGLVGGGTGLIGDPSGKASERNLLSPEQVDANVRGIRSQLERFLDFEGGAGVPAARLVDNSDWLRSLGAIELLRDVGKHFTVNYMLQKESVKARMDAGISFTEFSYMLLQAYDFLELHRREGVVLQMGGSDQWGNITAGVELIRRTVAKEAHALTFPLVTTSSGVKFGKSEAGAVWLDAARTSPYEFYQFWVNVDDRDAPRYLRFFTLLSRDEIVGLDQAMEQRPQDREAQRALARDVTRRVHGDDALRAAEEVSGFFFGGLEPRELSPAAFAMLRREAPFVEVSEADVADASGFDVYKLLTATGLAASNGAARRLLEQGGVSVNKRKLTAQERYVAVEETLLAGRHIILGKGRKEFALVQLR